VEAWRRGIHLLQERGFFTGWFAELVLAERRYSLGLYALVFAHGRRILYQGKHKAKVFEFDKVHKPPYRPVPKRRRA
jgi:hypothetical protein